MSYVYLSVNGRVMLGETDLVFGEESIADASKQHHSHQKRDHRLDRHGGSSELLCLGVQVITEIQLEDEREREFEDKIKGA